MKTKEQTLSATERKRLCIVTFARSWNGLAAVRCLGHHGISVITGDTSRYAAASFSRYSQEHFTYPDYAEDPKGFINSLLQVVHRHYAADTDIVVMPLHNEIYTVICNKKYFDGFAHLAIPTKEQFLNTYNKRTLANLCRAYAVRTPVTRVPATREEAEKESATLQYPVFIKIPTGSAAIGVQRVDSPDEAVERYRSLCERYELNEPDDLPIIQESVAGDDYCATFLFEHGMKRACMIYRNIACYPKHGGMGAIRETVDVPAIERIGTMFLEKMQWHGVAEIDFRWNGTDDPWLIEINPRFWGGLTQSIESGWEYPYLLYRLAVDGHVESVVPHRKNIKTWNPGLVVLLALEDMLEAPVDHHELHQHYLRTVKETPHHTALRDLLSRLGIVKTMPERMKMVRALLHEAEGSINEFFSWDDPFPVFGLLYPLTVYVRQGKITPEALVGKTHLVSQEIEG